MASSKFWLLVGGLAVVAGLLGFAGGSVMTVSRATPTPTPSPTVTTTESRLTPGTYSWDELLTGSCLTKFDGPWSTLFTVVDCVTPHTAQVIRSGTIPGVETAAYPGQETLSAKVLPLCTELGVINDDVAGANPALVFTFTYPTTAAEWRASGPRYACFASLSDVSAMSGSLVPSSAN